MLTERPPTKTDTGVGQAVLRFQFYFLVDVSLDELVYLFEPVFSSVKWDNKAFFKGAL